ncbi:MAG TPA: diguanylate cyclase, partial [Gaiellaceae bacterium]|nr:diguanylate cyclase [Gaiellaceae bacterium]
RSKRFDRPLSILLADLDLLRRVNNAHGHLAGDEVLKGVADVLRRELRPFDIPCRFGGEEFAVILPETGHEDAIAIAERIRRVVASTRFAVPGGDAEIRATVSLGVATHPENGSADELLQQADLALYRSKALGRNRVSGQAAVAGVRPAPVQARTPSVEPARERSSMQREVRLVEAVALLAAVGGVLLGLLAYERLGVLGPAIVAVSALLLAPLGARLVRLRSAVDEVQRRNQELEHRKQRVHRAYLTTVAALSRTADERGGQDWVRRVAVALGRSLGYRQEELEAIEVGAMLHDIGKLRVPDRILTKPGPLTESEWAEVKRHPVEADRLLAEAELHPFVRQIVRSSHERIDGTGYPDGLSGEQIPLPARIVLVADAFDALASDRPYRPARRLPEAIAELRANAGTQFCPTVLAALDRLWVDAPDSLRQTADGRRHTAARH